MNKKTTKKVSKKNVKTISIAKQKEKLEIARQLLPIGVMAFEGAYLAALQSNDIESLSMLIETFADTTKKYIARYKELYPSKKAR